MPETDEKPRKRMGRPPKAPEKGRRQNYTFRMSDETRDRVIAAAASSGRSMSEELEFRIEESFRNEDKIIASASLLNGSRNAYSLISKISSAISYIENLTDKSGNSLGSLDWRAHEPTRAGIRSALNSLIESATDPVSAINSDEVQKKISAIAERITSDNKLSVEDQHLLKKEHDKMLVDTMVNYGRLIAAVISGSIGLDQLKTAFKGDELPRQSATDRDRDH